MAYSISAKEIVGFRKKNDKEWIIEETLETIREWKEEKAKLMMCKSERLRAKRHERYSAANTKVKRCARRDKRRYVEGLAEEGVEKAMIGW